MSKKSSRKTRILTVDDDPGIRDVLTAVLTNAGYDCEEAESAESAASLLDEQEIDLVLLDISMPTKSGIDYLPELKLEHPDVAVVMLTGEKDISVAVRSMREGAFDFLSKPVGSAQLIIRIEHALGRKALEIENKGYQQKLEQIVDELNGRVAQRGREVSSLNKLFQAHIGQNEAAQRALMELQISLNSFNSEIRGLATIVGITPSETQSLKPSTE